MATYGDQAWCEAKLAEIDTDITAVMAAVEAVAAAPADYTAIQIGQVKKSRSEWTQSLNAYLKMLQDRQKFIFSLYQSIPQEQEDFFDFARVSRADDGVVYGR
jgi:uncharacterized protein YpuA (DUF1002 family)